MPRFSKNFGISGTQSELDFVDIDIDVGADTPLYLDPYALTTSDDEWSEQCHALIVSFFTAVLNSVLKNDRAKGERLLSHLGEPDETHLGVSSGGKGRGIGPKQAKEIFSALKDSPAAKSGQLEDLSDFALFVPQIARDKISDMTTNVVRLPLIEYTQSQCALYDVPTQVVPSGFFWDGHKDDWSQKYVRLPVFDNHPILLVPKFAVRWKVGVDHQVFRNRFVLEFLRDEHLRADTSLVTTIRDKKGAIVAKKVFKKDVDAHYPTDKEFLASFASKNPSVLDAYRDFLKTTSNKIPTIESKIFEREDAAERLISELKLVPSGPNGATAYHRIMVAVVLILFFPNVVYPKIELGINQGRKRLDIVCTNGKRSGLFYRLAMDQHIKANIVHIECKNYTNDIANAEFDQMIGRFDANRGRFGILMYRKTKDEQLVIARCRDAAKSGQGIIIPLNDQRVVECLSFVAKREYHKVDELLNNLYVDILG